VSVGRSRALVVVAVIALAVNLRLAVNAMGSVTPELRSATGLTGAAAGALLALPTLSFAVLGLLAAGLAARFGTHRTVVLALLALVVGQVVRSTIDGLPALFLGSAIALAGVAVSNVLMPGLVRLHFPQHIAAMTAVYTTSLSIGAAIASGVTLPIEHALSAGWQLGLGIWIVPALLALLPWSLLARGGRPPAARTTARSITLRRLAGTRLAWVMAGFFGTQALQAYVMFGWLPEILTDAGTSDTVAALWLSLLAVIGVVIAALVPVLLARVPVVVVVVTMALSYLAGYLGLIFDTGGPIWLWVVLVGIGTGAFPVALTLVGLRARTAPGTLALSGFAQSFGYLIASVGPFLFGLVHDLTGGWTVPLYLLMALVVVHLGFGLAAARTRYIEDELFPETGVNG
jgi:CP family cyanate transporter-like MFS transporter